MEIEELHAWLFYLNNIVINNWYLFTLSALVLYGVYQYLLDYSVNSNQTALPLSIATPVLVGGCCLTISVVSGLYLFYKSITGEILVGLFHAVLLGGLQGVLFLFVNIFRFESRKAFPNHVVLPVTRGSVLIVILASWFLFDELAKVTASKLVGFVLIGLAIYLFKEFDAKGSLVGDAESVHLQQNAGNENAQTVDARVKAAIYLVLATVVSAATALLSKYAVGPRNLNIWLFMFFSNYFSCIAAIFLIHQQKKNGKKKRSFRR